MPANYFAVHLFHMASRQIVAGMGGTIGMMSIEGARAVIDSYSHHFATAESEERMLELMWLIDRVATSTIQKSEERERIKAENDAKIKARNR